VTINTTAVGMTLHMLVREGDCHAVRSVLKKKRDPRLRKKIVNSRDAKKKRPLHYARSTRMIEILLRSGADPYACDQCHRTATHEFARTGMLASLQTLLRRGLITHERQDFAGATPLHLAKRRPVIRLLLQAGADPLARTYAGRTPLDAIDKHQQESVVHALIAASIDLEDMHEPEHTTLLQRAASNHLISSHSVRILLQIGAATKQQLPFEPAMW